MASRVRYSILGLWLFAFVISVVLGGPEAEGHHENYHSKSPHSEMDLAPAEIHSRHQHQRINKPTKVNEPAQTKESHRGEFHTNTENVGSASESASLMGEFAESNEKDKSAMRKSASAPSLSNPHSRNPRSAAATYLMSYPNPKSYYSRKTQRRTGRDYCDYFDEAEEGYAYCCYY